MSFSDRSLAVQAQVLPWMDQFVSELLRTEGDIDAAAALVHIDVHELHALRDKAPAFALAWDRATKVIRRLRAQRLEAQAYHDAAFGMKKFKFTPAGGPVRHPETDEPYFEIERDNRLVLGLLKALDRETYGDRSILTGKDGGPVQHVHAVATMADIVRIAAMVGEGKIAPADVVGELPGDFVDAEVVP